MEPRIRMKNSDFRTTTFDFMVRSVDGEYKIVKSKFIEFTKC